MPQERLGSDQDSSGEALENRQKRAGTLGDGQTRPKSYQSCVRVVQILCKAFTKRLRVKIRVYTLPTFQAPFFETCHEYVQTLNSPKQRQTLKHIKGSLDNLGPKPFAVAGFDDFGLGFRA